MYVKICPDVVVSCQSSGNTFESTSVYSTGQGFETHCWRKCSVRICYLKVSYTNIKSSPSSDHSKSRETTPRAGQLVGIRQQVVRSHQAYLPEQSEISFFDILYYLHSYYIQVARPSFIYKRLAKVYMFDSEDLIITS